MDDFKNRVSDYKLPLIILGICCLLMAILLVRENETEEAPSGQTVAEASYGVPVLNYHKIENKHHSLSVPIADFEQHMAWLSERGYHTITPDELYAFITEGKALPDNPVMITFDDGYSDNYLNAYPIMKKYGFTGTIFVVTSFLGKYNGYMTWEQAKELSDNGFSIESHTISHKSLTELTDDQLREELRESRQVLADKLGKSADYLAYPTGTYNLHIAQMVKEAGYKAAFTIRYDNVSRDTNVYAIERVPIFHTEHTNRDFLDRLDYGPLYSKLGWVKN